MISGGGLYIDLWAPLGPLWVSEPWMPLGAPWVALGGLLSNEGPPQASLWTSKGPPEDLQEDPNDIAIRRVFYHMRLGPRRNLMTYLEM